MFGKRHEAVGRAETSMVWRLYLNPAATGLIMMVFHTFLDTFRRLVIWAAQIGHEPPWSLASNAGMWHPAQFL